MREKDKSSVSVENGFTGKSDAWFDDTRYNKPNLKANFIKKSLHDSYY